MFNMRTQHKYVLEIMIWIICPYAESACEALLRKTVQPISTKYGLSAYISDPIKYIFLI